MTGDLSAAFDALRASGWAEVGPQMTCHEAEALSEVLTLAGAPDIGGSLLACHAHGDCDCEDMHHATWLKLRDKTDCPCQAAP